MELLLSPILYLCLPLAVKHSRGNFCNAESGNPTTLTSSCVVLLFLLWRLDRARWIVALREHKQEDLSSSTVGKLACFTDWRSLLHAVIQWNVGFHPTSHSRTIWKSPMTRKLFVHFPSTLQWCAMHSLGSQCFVTSERAVIPLESRLQCSQQGFCSAVFFFHTNSKQNQFLKWLNPNVCKMLWTQC